jgi:hypothetical protein
MGTTNKDLSHSINCIHCSFNRSIPPICQDRICLVCGNDHGFRNNFAGVTTSIDIIVIDIDGEQADEIFQEAVNTLPESLAAKIRHITCEDRK